MLRLILLAALLPAIPAANAEEAAAAAFTQKSRLANTKWKFKTIRFNFPLAGGAKATEKPTVRKGKVEGLWCFFLDLDGNGQYGEIGKDAWALGGMNYVLPMEETTVLELRRVRWRVTPDGKEVQYSSSALPIAKEEAKVFRQFNYWRLINGVPPVDIDPKLGEACSELCTWMEANGMKHRPEEGDPPMSPRAAEAGMRSMLSQETPGMSILMLYSSFYHRLPLFRPGTRAIGIGKSARYTAVDGMSRAEMRAWRYPIIVPAPSTALQPTHFPPESPRPYPASLRQPGFPITLTFDGGEVTDAKATLRQTVGKGRRKKEIDVPVLVSSPSAPANKSRPRNRNSICVIPKRPLSAKARYSVWVAYKLNGEQKEHRWVFTTGRARPVWR
jgi:hypothetical protein